MTEIKKILIPIYDEEYEMIGVIDSRGFKDNFTSYTLPDYMNCNARVCLRRLGVEHGKYYKNLCIIYYYPENPMLSYAELLSEQEAYTMCLNRERLDIASELELKFVREVEVS